MGRPRNGGGDRAGRGRLKGMGGTGGQEGDRGVWGEIEGHGGRLRSMGGDGGAEGRPRSSGEETKRQRGGTEEHGGRLREIWGGRVGVKEIALLFTNSSGK